MAVLIIESPIQDPATTNRKLRDGDLEILRCLALGISKTQTGKLLGVSRTTVHRLRNSDAGREAMAELHEKRSAEFEVLQQRILDGSELALDALEDTIGDLTTLESGQRLIPPQTRVNAAADWLDRAGFAPVKVTKKEVTKTTISVDTIQHLQELGRKQLAVEDVPPPLEISAEVEKSSENSSERSVNIGDPDGPGSHIG